MYEVEMIYLTNVENDESINFRCENFYIGNNGYKFNNILMDNFNIIDLEVNNEDIASIMIK